MSGRAREIMAAYRTWDVQDTLGPQGYGLIVTRRLSPGMTMASTCKRAWWSRHWRWLWRWANGRRDGDRSGPALLAIAESSVPGGGAHEHDVPGSRCPRAPSPPDAAFDRVTSRLGVMYSSNSPGPCRRSAGCLAQRPRRRSSPWVRSTTSVPILVAGLFRYVAPPEPEPGAVDPFMFAVPGSLSRVLREAGFLRCRRGFLVTVPTPFPGHHASTGTGSGTWRCPCNRCLRPWRPRAAAGGRRGARRAPAVRRREQVTLPVQVVAASGIR